MLEEAPYRGLAAIRRDGEYSNFLNSLFILMYFGLSADILEGLQEFMEYYFGSKSPQDSYEMLCSALDAMEPDKIAEAVANACNTTGLPGSLKTRRTAFAEKHGIQLTTLDRWEGAGVAEMIQILDRQARERSAK